VLSYPVQAEISALREAWAQSDDEAMRLRQTVSSAQEEIVVLREQADLTLCRAEEAEEEQERIREQLQHSQQAVQRLQNQLQEVEVLQEPLAIGSPQPHTVESPVKDGELQSPLEQMGWLPRSPKPLETSARKMQTQERKSRRSRRQDELLRVQRELGIIEVEKCLQDDFVNIYCTELERAQNSKSCEASPEEIPCDNSISSPLPTTRGMKGLWEVLLSTPGTPDFDSSYAAPFCDVVRANACRSATQAATPSTPRADALKLLHNNVPSTPNTPKLKLMNSNLQVTPRTPEVRKMNHITIKQQRSLI